MRHLIDSVEDRSRSVLPTARLVVAAALLAMSTVGCLTPYEKSRRALAQDDFEGARRHANEALEASDQSDPRAYLLLAQSYVEQEAYQEAKPFAQKAYQTEQTRGQAGRLLGQIHWETGRPVEAARTWGEARKAQPGVVSDEDYRESLVVGVEESRRTNAYETALELQRKLRDVAEDHALASPKEIRRSRRALAEQLVDSGELQRAASIFESLAEESEAPDLWRELGRLRLRLGKLEPARQAFNRYVGAGDTSDSADRAREVGKLAGEQDEHDLAVDFLLRSRSALEKPTFERAKIELSLAKHLFALERSDSGRQYIQTYLKTMRSLRGRPLAADVYLTVVSAATDYNQSTYAAELLEQALQTAPPDWTVAARLAQHYAVQVRDQEVRRVLETFVERSNDTVNSLTRCARWARDRQNFSLAREFLQRAIDASDSAPELRMELARTLDRQGDIERLKKVLDTYVQRFPDRRHGLLEVASLYAKHKLYADAEGVLGQLRRRSPESLVIVDRLAALYREWGKTDRIEDAYRAWLEARGGEATDFELVGDRFSRHGSTDLALEFLKRAAELGESDAWLQVAELYKRQQRDKEMRKALESYLAAKDRSPNALRAVLELLDSSSLNQFTIDVLEDLIEQQPSQRRYYERLAAVRLDQGNRAAAFDVWRRYVDRVGRSVDVLETIGEWFQSSGHSGLALPFYRQWLNDVDDPRLYLLLGKAYLASGRRDAIQRVMNPRATQQNQSYARRYFEKYLSAGQFEGIELLEFAAMLRDNNMWQPAARAYGRALRDQPPGDAAQLEYALTLLKLGHAGRALEVQSAYFEERGESTEAASRIVDQLMDADLYRSALPYLDALMTSGIPNLRNKAFNRTLEAYVHLGRHDEVDALVDTYLDEAANPAKARQLAVQALARRGLIRRAVDQIERMRELQGDVMGLKLGVYYLRLGQSPRAWDQFATYADNHSFGTDAWLEIASAYEQRAMPDRAQRAYDRAVRTSSDGFQAHIERALFELRRGRFDQARQDYDTAVDRASGRATFEIHKRYIEALREVGRFGRAYELAREVRPSANSRQSFFAERYFDDALDLATPERSKRLIDELKRSPLDLEVTVSLLHQHGFLDEAVDLIDQEFQNGNLATAGRVLASHPATITAVGGRDLLARLARPLLRSTSLKRPIRARLGAYMIRQGDYRRGIRYLSEAETPQPIFWPMLVQAHVNRGHFRRAIDLVREYESNQSTSGPGMGLWEQAALRFGLAGHHDEFVRELGLDHLGPEAPPALLRLHIEQILDEGEPRVAFERLRRVAHAGSTQAHVAGPDVQRRVEQLTAGVSALAERGFTQEAATLLDAVDGDMQQHPIFREFEVRFDARFRPDHLDTALAADLEAPVNLDDILGRIEMLMIAQRFDRTRSLLDELPDKMTPGFTHRAAEIRTLLEYLDGSDDQRANPTPKLAVAESEDPFGASQHAYRTARRLGWDASAFDQMDRLFEQSRTPSRATRLLSAAQTTTSGESAERAAEAFFRHVDKPVGQLHEDLLHRARRLDPSVLEPLLARVSRVRSASMDLMFARTIVDVRTGETERARRRLLEYLRSVSFHPLAVNRIAQFLDQERLPAELRFVVRTAIERRGDEATSTTSRDQTSAVDAVTRQALMDAALASASLGFDADFKRWAKRALVGAPAEATLAQRAATEACRRQLVSACRYLADRTTDLAPERPPGWFATGIADILEGRADQGASNIRRGLRGGVDRFFALEHAARAALKVNATSLADDYLAELLETPNPAQVSPLEPLQRVIDAYTAQSAQTAGIDMLERRYPALVTNRGPAGQRASRVLTSLYQGAGNHQKAYSLYDSVIDETWLRTDLSNGAAAVLMNNLAYAYATGGHKLAEAQTLVGIALGFSRRRTASYIDTRGWISYRQGHLERAEADVRRSIHSAETDASLAELFGHLAEIRRARQDHAGAFWLDRMATRYR